MTSNQLLFLLNQRQREVDKMEEPSREWTNVSNVKHHQSSNVSMKRTVPKALKQQPYVSPFVKKANEIAKQRAQLALRKIKTASYREQNKPEMDLKLTSEYFDPKLRKQEIFKIEPRIKSKKEEMNPVTLPLKKLSSTDMTRRTVGVRLLCNQEMLIKFLK